MKHLFILTFTLLMGTALTQAQDTNYIVTLLADDTTFFMEPRHPHHPSALGISSDNSMHLLYDLPVTHRELIQGCRHLTLDIDAAGFFFDAEYATPFAKGFSVAGFRLSPALAYGINERAQLRVGLNATAFAGLDSLYRLRPTFSLIYAPTKWLTLVAGTIYGNNTHQLAPAVYDPSRWIYNYQEDGLQILTKTSIWSSDTWLDWNHYLTPWTADQERFTMGTNHIFRIAKLNIEKKVWDGCDLDKYNQLGWQFNLPVHFIASHRGGEVKTIDTNTVTTFNERVGLQIKYSFSNTFTPSFHTFKLDASLYNYHLEDKTLDHGGKAFYPTLSYEWLNWNQYHLSHFSLRAIAGYWHGDHYFSAFGSPLFWSANAYSALHIPASASLAGATDIRNLLTFTISAEHEFKGLNLGLQVDALYDLDLKKTDFLFGFYMRFREKIILL